MKKLSKSLASLSGSIYKAFVQSLSDGPPHPVRITVAATIGARTLDNFINNLSRKNKLNLLRSVYYIPFLENQENFLLFEDYKKTKKGYRKTVTSYE